MGADIRRMLIVGGGIGGMSAAIVFRRMGVEVDLVDIDPQWKVYGAGITITGPTLRAFKALGILDAVGREGFFYDSIRFCAGNGHFIEELKTPPLEPGIPGGGGILRPVLHRILSDVTIAQGAKVKLGVTVTAFSQDADGVDVTFSDGRERRYDMVVGSDGANSGMRPKLLPDAPKPVFTGQGCWRLLADRPKDMDWAEIYFGPNSVKSGLTPCSPDQLYLFVTVPMPGNPHIADEDLPEGLRQALAPFGGRIGALRDALGPDSMINYRPLLATFVEPPWHVGRVGLIGDAVHPTTPHLASGAGITIEDALVLGQEMQKADSIEAGWAAFTARRVDRARMVVVNSVKLGELEMEGGRDDDVRQLMGSSTHALAAPI